MSCEMIVIITTCYIIIIYYITTGSLVAVPVLSAGLKVSDSFLAMVGALSAVLDYVLYGLVTPTASFLIWIGEY